MHPRSRGIATGKPAVGQALSLVVAVLAWAMPALGQQPLQRQYRLEDCDKRMLAKVQVRPRWLPPNAIALGVPPDATTTAAEIAVLLTLQATRTQADIAKIKAEAGDLVAPMLALLGTMPAHKPKTAALLRMAISDLEFFLFREKLALLRLRPHQVDARLRPAIAVPRHPAFPSGHGGTALALALLLAELHPQSRDTLLAFAQQVGWRRELAGVHFPSDTEDGRRIGAQVVAQLLATPEFAVLMLDAKVEWPPTAASRSQSQ